MVYNFIIIIKNIEIEDTEKKLNFKTSWYGFRIYAILLIRYIKKHEGMHHEGMHHKAYIKWFSVIANYDT